MIIIKALIECVEKIMQIRAQNKEKMANHERVILKSSGKHFDEKKYYFGIEHNNFGSRIYLIRKYGNSKISYFDEVYSDKGIEFRKIIY